jgi:hypothetical protein
LSNTINYEGGECHQPKREYTALAIADTQPKYTIRFHNIDGDEVGIMDFNGPGLAFEGNAEESAIVFMTWISKVFQQRLKEEYDRGRAVVVDKRASQKTQSS